MFINSMEPSLERPSLETAGEPAGGGRGPGAKLALVDRLEGEGQQRSRRGPLWHRSGAAPAPSREARPLELGLEGFGGGWQETLGLVAQGRGGGAGFGPPSRATARRLAGGAGPGVCGGFTATVAVPA
jgi:hypothetical protein